MTAETKNLLTVREVARICGRTSETVRRWIWDGKLPARKLGNQLFVERADLTRFAAPEKRVGREARVALLVKIRARRERIRRQAGGNLDVLGLLDRSRESHP